MYYEELLHLPKIPDMFTNSILNTPIRYPTLDRKIITKNNEQIENCIFGKINLAHYDIVLLGWIKKNICINDYIVLNRSYKRWFITKTKDGNLMIPHIDRGTIDNDIHILKNTHVLKYFIDLGGDNVTTTWYQEEGYPEFRKDHLQISTYDNLIAKESVVAKINTWYLFNSKIIHGVENIQNTRTSISIWF